MFTIKLARMMNPKVHCQSGCLIRSRAECCVVEGKSIEKHHSAAKWELCRYPHFFQNRSLVKILARKCRVLLDKCIPFIKDLLILQRKNVLATSIVTILANINHL
jgi:hypothetical protein